MTHLWKVAGQRVVFAVVDLPDPESLDRALAGLPIVQELGGGAGPRRSRSTTTGSFAADMKEQLKG